MGSSLLKPVNRDVKKFMIISRARSGSTLLTQLLNSHPDVHCGRELLANRVLFAERYLNRLAEKSTMLACGSKLLSYQMAQVQRFRNPVEFLDRLNKSGFRLIHLERDTFSQTLSLAIAQTTRLFHQKDSAGSGAGKRKWDNTREPVSAKKPIHIDIDDFLRRLEWSDMLLEYERHCLRDLPHLAISYDKDLQASGDRQHAADRAFDWIGVPSVPVSVGLKKILPPDSKSVIANYDELATRMRKQSLARLLPD